MKRIVLCFDGTWNTPDDDPDDAAGRVQSNVRWFYESVAGVGADGVSQQAWYNPGVGTRWYTKVLGGAFGWGLDTHLMDGYQHLVQTYEDGDEVYVLGFSRGAYTARSLVGMIRNCGLVRPSLASWAARGAYAIYRTRDGGPDTDTAVAFREQYGREIDIHFLGVWDTVGALGIPLNVADKWNLAMYRFHDTNLSRIVKHAYHAVALDEFRKEFDVCLWDPREKPEQEVEQRWFAGAHANVGGGYPDRLLADLSLAWMQQKAAACGLGLEPVVPAADGYGGVLVDSYAEFWGRLPKALSDRHTRTVFGTPFGGEVLDPSVDLRRRAAALGYAPGNPGLPALVVV